PGRRNLVVTRNPEFRASSAEVVYSLEEGLARTEGDEKIFIIGGAQLYRLSLEQADTLILTELEQEVAGDVFFPEFSCPPFALVQTEDVTEPVHYSIRTYQRRQDAEKVL
ncbi:MAG: hypothetical protein D3906_16180, partial [Candidatus Electrothrix sp. AUS1_2]|nr:hypothetical protein [Candidatus Electrothrix sp. AUS1_2]